MWVLIFFITFVWNMSHSKKKWARYDQEFILWSRKVLDILVRFQWKWTILKGFSKNTPNQFSLQSVQRKASFAMQTDGQLWRS